LTIKKKLEKSAAEWVRTCNLCHNPRYPQPPTPPFQCFLVCLFVAWMVLLRREAGGNRKRKKERVRRRQSQGRERENTTDARRFPTTEEGKRKKVFFEHETLWFDPGDCASSPT
jgi:hypothetical protein